ncbi:MAG: RNA-splicing ligase RtcB [Candidatus Altiarchaeales archaeon]|nr:RNA-splicing ligase RtcB [Candidatus Altiarchaeales archaeon]
MDVQKISQGVRQFHVDGMRVPARIYASDELYPQIERGVFNQIKNVAQLPGVVDHVCVMPDGHFGYGFPIGGVAAFSLNEGVISPGGVGYDINCGVRLLSSNLREPELKGKLQPLIDSLFKNIPSGVGSKSRLRVDEETLKRVCLEGAGWAVSQGYGEGKDLKHTEESGCIPDADYSKIGHRARKRGKPQLGTLGSGNHFLEIQVVEEVFDGETAQTFGVTEPGQVMFMIHCGSRGLGYQVADDYIKVMLEASRRQKINLPDPELACAYLDSRPAIDYVAAMYCAVNYAFANRQCIAHWVRETVGGFYPHAQLSQVYDVCHNIAKFEEHKKVGDVCVHRKGATRAFSEGRRELPEDYRRSGQPVIVPGDMGSSSYLLVGLEAAMTETFGSVCHGAGRVLSRSKARRNMRGEDVARKLLQRGQYARAENMKVLAEEYSDAYKNIDEVVKSVSLPSLAAPVARFRPLGVVKG